MKEIKALITMMGIILLLILVLVVVVNDNVDLINENQELVKEVTFLQSEWNETLDDCGVAFEKLKSLEHKYLEDK